MPLLLQTRTAVLVRHAARGRTDLEAVAAAHELDHVLRAQALGTAIYESRLATVLRLVAAHGVEPLLLKGWSVARLYPARGMRTCGDVDLAVPAEDHERLQAVFHHRATDRRDWIAVDLEHYFLTSDGTPLTTLKARAERHEIGGEPVLTAGPEDLLRHVCLHFLRAGGWQARALCDVALLLERRVEGFDWDLVLGDRLHRNWVTVAAGLAEELLGADLTGTPLAGARARVPPWVRRQVVESWSESESPELRNPAPLRLDRRPARIVAQLGERIQPLGLERALHHRRRIPRRSPVPLAAYDLAYRGIAFATPLRLRRARRDGTPERAP